mgnify:CR=1 FL=1
MGSVIDYIPGSSLLHRLNPVTKLALAAAIILATFLADTYGLLIALLALTIALGAYARATSGLVSLAKLMVPLSAIMLVLQTAFIRTGDPVFAWVTVDGLVTGSKAALRLLGVALPLILMLTVTKLNDHHTYLAVAPGTEVAVGEVLRFGISHPCTAFDKWRLIPVVDRAGVVVDVLPTYF